MENKYLYAAVFIREFPNADYVISHRIYGAPSHFHAKAKAGELAVSEKDLQGFKLHTVEFIVKISELVEGTIGKI